MFTLHFYCHFLFCLELPNFCHGTVSTTHTYCRVTFKVHCLWKLKYEQNILCQETEMTTADGSVLLYNLCLLKQAFEKQTNRQSYFFCQFNVFRFLNSFTAITYQRQEQKLSTRFHKHTQFHACHCTEIMAIWSVNVVFANTEGW